MKKLIKIVLIFLTTLTIHAQIEDYPWYWQNHLSPIFVADTMDILGKVKFGTNGSYIDSVIVVGDTAFVYQGAKIFKWITNPGSSNIEPDSLGVVEDVDLTALAITQVNTNQIDYLPIVVSIVDTLHQELRDDVFVVGYDSTGGSWMINIYSSVAYDSLTIYYIKGGSGLITVVNGGSVDTTSAFSSGQILIATGETTAKGTDNLTFTGGGLNVTGNLNVNNDFKIKYDSIYMTKADVSFQLDNIYGQVLIRDTSDYLESEGEYGKTYANFYSTGISFASNSTTDSSKYFFGINELGVQIGKESNTSNTDDSYSSIGINDVDGLEVYYGKQSTDYYGYKIDDSKFYIGHTDNDLVDTLSKQSAQELKVFTPLTVDGDVAFNGDSVNLNGELNIVDSQIEIDQVAKFETDPMLLISYKDNEFFIIDNDLFAFYDDDVADSSVIIKPAGVTIKTDLTVDGDIYGTSNLTIDGIATIETYLTGTSGLNLWADIDGSLTPLSYAQLGSQTASIGAQSVDYFYSNNITIDTTKIKLTFAASLGKVVIKPDSDGDTTAVFDSAQVEIFKDLVVDGDFTYNLRHLFVDYAAAYTPSVTQDVYTKIAPTFTEVEVSNITFAGDSITIIDAGDYLGELTADISGAVTDNFVIVYKKNGTIVKSKKQSTRGATEDDNIVLKWYFDNLIAGDHISIWVTNTNSSGDPTFSNMDWEFEKKHD